MRTMPMRWTRWLPLTLALLLCPAVNALAQQQQPQLPPANFVAPELPKADDTNGQRAISQPGNNAPFWRGVRHSGEQQGTVNLPGLEKGTLIQSFVQYPGSQYTTAGEAWRQTRNRWIIPYGGALVIVTLVALALFYMARGSLGAKVANTGRKIERFSYFERAAHWCNAIAFVVLAVSGLVLAFGKFLLLPLLGPNLFGWLSYGLKTLHNFAGPLFAVTLVIVFLTFVRDNFFNASDRRWLAKAGGLLGGAEPASHRFNAGEKLIFWLGVVVLGLVVVGAGLVMDQLVPGIAYTRANMQIANMVHGIAALLMTCMFLGHIYMGTIGMKGAYRAMRDGYVDEAWAAEHHELWYEDIRAGRIPARRGDAPASDVAPIRAPT